MYVCICRQITDQQIRDFCRDGSATMAEAREALGLATDCGRCGKYARQIIAETAAMVAKCSDIAYAA